MKFESMKSALKYLIFKTKSYNVQTVRHWNIKEEAYYEMQSKW